MYFVFLSSRREKYAQKAWRVKALPTLILQNGMRLTCFLQVSSQQRPANIVLEGTIIIFYTITAIFVKLKFAFKAFLG